MGIYICKATDENDSIRDTIWGVPTLWHTIEAAKRATQADYDEWRADMGDKPERLKWTKGEELDTWYTCWAGGEHHIVIQPIEMQP